MICDYESFKGQKVYKSRTQGVSLLTPLPLFPSHKNLDYFSNLLKNNRMQLVMVQLDLISQDSIASNSV